MVNRTDGTETPDGWQSAQLTCFLAVFLVVPAFVFLERRLIRGDLVPDVYLLMPAVYLILSGCIFVYCSLPSTLRHWLLLLFSHAFVIAALILLSSSGRHQFLLRTVAVALRVCTVAAAVIPIAGLVLFAETIRRGKLRWKAWVPSVLGVSLVVGVAAVSAELTARMLESTSDTKMPLPVLPASSPRAPKLIVAIGGSTMTGFPYAPQYGVGQVAEWLLRQNDADDFEFVNLAVTGASLSIAAAELRLLDRRPDVLIVYSGHNEFFHELPELGLSRKTDYGRIDEALNHSAAFRIVNKFIQQHQVGISTVDRYGGLVSQTVCSELVRVRRLKRFEDRVRRLLEWAEAGETAVVYCVPAADEADFAPSKSSCRTCSRADEERLLADLSLIRQHQKAGDFERAGQICEDVITQFPDVAEFHFRAGECDRSMHRFDSASWHFQRALELDQFPIRMRESYRIVGKQLAEEFGATIIDSAQLLRDTTQDGLLGRDVFIDGVHLNLRGSFVVGREIARKILDDGLLNSPTHVVADRGFVDSLNDLAFTAETLAAAYETTAKVLHRYAVFREFDRTKREERSDAFRLMAEQLRAGSVVPGDGGTESLTNEAATAAAGN